MSDVEFEEYVMPPDGFHASASTFKEIEAILREYEIKHIVKYACCRRNKHFDQNIEPWKINNMSRLGPKLLWGSDAVPPSDAPYITVARKLYSCQYGKQRHNKKEVACPQPSYKMGCPCHCDVVEILRLVEPKAKRGVNGEVTKYQRREVAIKYREGIRKQYNGLASNLVWQREFHINISPLSAHSHVIGEGAAEHQRIDPLLIEKIHELAAAGITTSDVIRDHLVHYVEQEMFKDQELPLRSNRRFYPNSRDIRNHVYLAKSNVEKQRKTILSFSESELAATSITDEGVIYHDDGETVQVARYESVQQYQQQEYQPGQQYYTSNGFSEYTSPSKNQGYGDTSYSTVSASKKSRRSAMTEAPGTTKRGVRGKTRTPKEKFVGLVKKLYRIADVIDYEYDTSQLTASVINALMLAKPLVPEHKVGVLFEEETRELLHPRRFRTYKKKPPVPRKRRFPDINPDATKLPDKKALKREAKQKELEARNAKKAKMLAEGNRLLQEAASKRNVEPNLSHIRIVIAGKDGKPAPTVVVEDKALKALATQIPALLQQKGQKTMLQHIEVAQNSSGVPRITLLKSPNQNPTEGSPVSLLKTPKLRTLFLNPNNQSLIGAVKTSTPSGTILNTPLQSLGIVTENKSSSSKFASVNYTSILPGSIAATAVTNSSVTVSPLPDKDADASVESSSVIPAKAPAAPSTHMVTSAPSTTVEQVTIAVSTPAMASLPDTSTGQAG